MTLKYGCAWVTNVLGYRGSLPTTFAGVPVWGFPGLVHRVANAPQESLIRHPWVLGWLLEHPWLIGVLKESGWQAAFLSLLLLSWLHGGPTGQLYNFARLSQRSTA